MLGFSDPKTKNIVDEKIKRKVTREEKGRDQSQRKLKDFVVTERHALFFKREREVKELQKQSTCAVAIFLRSYLVLRTWDCVPFESDFADQEGNKP